MCIKQQLNLYLLEQNKNTGYDTYDSAVVCALNEGAAKMLHPSGQIDWKGENEDSYGSWCNAVHVKVTFLGIASITQEAGLILASFNAG